MYSEMHQLIFTIYMCVHLQCVCVRVLTHVHTEKLNLH